MAYEAPCSSSAKNTGTKNLCGAFGVTERFIRTAADFEGLTEAEAKTGAAWQVLIQANDAYPFPIINGLVNNDSEPVNQELANGMQEVTKGKIIIDYTFFSNPLIQRQLLSHDGLPSAIYEIDDNGSIKGIINSEGKILPIPVQLFQVQKGKRPNATDSGYTTDIKVVISDVDTYEKDFAIVYADNLDFNAKTDLEGLQPVTLTQVGDATATGITVKATISGTDNTLEGAFSETVGEDFELTDVDGTAATITDISDDGSGEYTLTFATLLTGYTVSLKDPTEMTTEGYAADNTITGTF